MGLVDVLPRTAGRPWSGGMAAVPDVAILEDEAPLAELAAQVCDQLGLSAASYRAPAALLGRFDSVPPRVVILDWRLERDVGAATFMALRHRFGAVPIVCWTGMPVESLPAMVAGDRRTRVVRKAGRLEEFESALRWALAAGDEERSPR